jgi:hypothetical protein
VAGQLLAQDAAEVLLGGAVGRAVVVGQVEVGDPQVERAPDDRLLAIDLAIVSEVVPQPERHERQLQSAAPAAAVGHLVVAAHAGNVPP